jgi:hypothetical protein
MAPAAMEYCPPALTIMLYTYLEQRPVRHWMAPAAMEYSPPFGNKLYSCGLRRRAANLRGLMYDNPGGKGEHVAAE